MGFQFGTVELGEIALEIIGDLKTFDLPCAVFQRQNCEVRMAADTIKRKAYEIQGASEMEVDLDHELKKLTGNGWLLKQEGKEVEKILMRNNPDDGVQGGATLWKLTQAITAHARELSPERSRELHEISGELLGRVKVNA